MLAPALRLADSVDGFLHRGGHDLTGYEDGTENPVDQDAVDAAIVPVTSLAWPAPALPRSSCGSMT
jgi:deferrochelatase/peroxidase EfeB